MRGLLGLLLLLLALDGSLAAVIAAANSANSEANLAGAVGLALEANSKGLAANSERLVERVLGKAAHSAKTLEATNKRASGKSSNYQRNSAKSGEAQLASIAAIANSPHMVHAIHSMHPDYVKIGPSPFSADCYHRGQLWKHEEVWVISNCLSYCECKNGEAECTERKCSDNEKLPSPKEHLEEEDERKRKEAAKYRERNKTPPNTYPSPNSHPNTSPYDKTQGHGIPPTDGHFSRDIAPAPGPRPHSPNLAGYPPRSATYRPFRYPNHDLMNFNNGFFGDNSFRDGFASIFRPIFGDSEIRNRIFQGSGGFGSSHYDGIQGVIHHGSGHGGSTHRSISAVSGLAGTQSSVQGSHGGVQATHHVVTHGREYGREYNKAHKYDKGYQRAVSYGTGTRGGKSYGGNSESSGSFATGGQSSGSYSTGAHSSERQKYSGGGSSSGGGTSGRHVSSVGRSTWGDRKQGFSSGGHAAGGYLDDSQSHPH